MRSDLLVRPQLHQIQVCKAVFGPHAWSLGPLGPFPNVRADLWFVARIVGHDINSVYATFYLSHMHHLCFNGPWYPLVLFGPLSYFGIHPTTNAKQASSLEAKVKLLKRAQHMSVGSPSLGDEIRLWRVCRGILILCRYPPSRPRALSRTGIALWMSRYTTDARFARPCDGRRSREGLMRGRDRIGHSLALDSSPFRIPRCLRRPVLGTLFLHVINELQRRSTGDAGLGFDCLLVLSNALYDDCTWRLYNEGGWILRNAYY